SYGWAWKSRNICGRTTQAGALAVKLSSYSSDPLCLHQVERAIGSRSVAAPRLLVLADPKMLAALANGLRESGRFDVLPVPLSDGGAAAAAAPRADAVAVFYGTPGHPLGATVQMLAAAVRGKGGRIIAVLQREN